MKKIKQIIIKAVLKYYPPVVVFILIAAVLLFVGITLEAINQLCTPNLPLQYR